MAVSDKTWHEVFDRDSGYCRYCEEDLLLSISRYRSAEMDHLLPSEHPDRDGGEHLVLSCGPCNKSLSRAHAQGLATFDSRKNFLELSEHRAGYLRKYQEHLERRIRRNNGTEG